MKNNDLNIPFEEIITKIPTKEEIKQNKEKAKTLEKLIKLLDEVSSDEATGKTKLAIEMMKIIAQTYKEKERTL